MKHHYLFLSKTSDSNGIYVCLQKSNINIISENRDLLSLAPEIGTESLNVVIADHNVSKFHLELKARNQTQLAKAASYAIEDKIPEPLEKYQITTKRVSKDSVQVQLIKRSKITELLEKIEDAKLKISSLYTESDLINNNSPALIFNKSGAILVGTELSQNYEFDTALVPIISNKIFTLLNDAKELQVISDEADKLTIEAFENSAPETIRLKKISKNNSYYESLSLNNKNATNLLQGEFSQHDKSESLSSFWNYTFWLTTASIIIFTGGAFAQNQILDNRLQKKFADLSSQYTDTFPNTREPRNIEDLAQRLKTKLNQNSIGNSNSETVVLDPLSLFSVLSSSKTPNVDVIGITLDTNRTEILVSGSDVESVNKFKADFTKNLDSDRTVSMDSINAKNDSYHGKISIR